MMAKEATDAETRKVTRRQRQIMEAKKQMNEAKETSRGRKYGDRAIFISSRGRGRVTEAAEVEPQMLFQEYVHIYINSENLLYSRALHITFRAFESVSIHCLNYV